MQVTGLQPKPRGGRAVPATVFAMALLVAFIAGAQLRPSTSYASTTDSCVAAESADTHTVMTKTTNYYNCHPDTGDALPNGGVIGQISQGSNPAVTGRWWNTVAVDGDGPSGSSCQPTTKWLRGGGFNWFSATCTQAP
jgi:hypothetical protein